MDRWTQYCSELYNNNKINGDPSVFTCSESGNDDEPQILLEAVETRVRALKNGKYVGVGNVLAELIKHGRETVTDMLNKICKETWRISHAPRRETCNFVET